MRKKTAKKKISLTDVELYARSVLEGKIVAGPHVRNACQRHLNDLKDGKKRGIYWDDAAANRAIAFFPKVLRLNGGQFEGQPFELTLWQKFIVGSIFGWKRANGFRRFKMAFIETGKGSGKSPLAAGIGLLMMMADNEPGAEVYSAAVDKEQARVLFRDAISMAKQSPAIAGRVVFSGGEGREWNIAYLNKGSFFRPISSESSGRGKSGFRPHCSLLDELHEHPTDAMVEFLAKGMKGRRQALTFMITNSGSDRNSVCWDYHEYGTKVCAGELAADDFFAYICALDEGDDPLKDESCWPKANPNLGITFQHEYLRSEVKKALGMPSKRNLTLRLNFCVWTDSEAAWMGREAWQSCERELDFSELLDVPCFAALDLSAKRDLTACARVWKIGEKYKALVDFWTPEETLSVRADKDRVPYLLWRDQEFLQTTPGVTVNYGHIAPWLAEMNGFHGFHSIAYDRWRIDLLKQEMDDIGLSLPLAEFGQGFKDMGPAIEALEDVILSGALEVQINPVLRWNVSSAVLQEDPARNRKFAKHKATGRIDGIVALAMAIGIAKLNKGEKVEPKVILL